MLGAMRLSFAVTSQAKISWMLQENKRTEYFEHNNHSSQISFFILGAG